MTAYTQQYACLSPVAFLLQYRLADIQPAPRELMFSPRLSDPLLDTYHKTILVLRSLVASM